ncbi:MAG: type I secretion system permease/ATPase [Desulfuromonadaceae bacterium]|nr:type I secretion system permease/ATPase [Desulfuromonadaceae bacterium]
MTDPTHPANPTPAPARPAEAMPQPVQSAQDDRENFDPLLECLLVIVALRGGVLSREAAIAGLPLEQGRLTPSLIERSARKGGLSSRIVRQPLKRLNIHLLPALLLLKDHRSCVLIGLDAAGGTAKVVFPEHADAQVELPLETLLSQYSGRIVYLQPRFRFDARVPEVGQVRRRHWFWSAMAENSALYRDVLMAAFFLSLFALAMPLFVRNVYDRVVPNQAVNTLWVLAIGVGIVLVGDLILRTMRSYFLDLASKRVDVKLSAYIMERVLATRLEHRPISAGSFAANLRSFETVRDFITSTTVTAFIDLPFALVFLLVIGLIAWPMTLPIIVGMAVSIVGSLMVQGKMHELSETTYRASAQRNATLIESLVGLETLKALGAESTMQRKWESSVIFLSQIANRLRLLSAATMGLAQWVAQTVNVAMIVLGVYLIMDNQLTMGGLIACSILSARAMAPIGQVAGLLTQYHHATTAFASLNTIMAQPTERQDDANFLTRTSFQGEIEFKDVSFCYPGQDFEVLKGVSFKIKAGERVAILGRVGSGKTTLLKLMLGLYQPSQGSVHLDGIDLRQLDPAEVRRSCGYVSQEATLFYGTLRDNLTLGMTHVEDREIVRAASMGALLDFVNGHPKGFDMLVGERGESLSGGQRQGVAIARAVIKNPEIILLDEPTGSMDHTSEEQVKQAFDQFTHGKTMVLVTHRTSLLALAERILVIDHGKIVADGPKKQVLEALRQGRIGRAS